ncbi:MAG TPA: ribose 5-phosphate isomerase B [Terriglobales bacterium]|jgi:ribose 5-phosphate isomerase B
MKIALGSDHAGFELKEKIKLKLQAQGIIIQDRGTHSADSCDYPDYAQAVADEVAAHGADFGILVCGTGIGMSIAANKVPGIRAARAVTESDAELAREHNDANVLTLGARITGDDEAFKIIDKWLATPFTGGDRHVRRIDKIMAIEREEETKSSTA